MISFTINSPHLVQCRMPQTEDDFDAFQAFMDVHAEWGTVLGLDCETNAVHPRDPGYALRLVQISDGVSAWLIEPCERLRAILHDYPRFVAQFPGIAEIPFLALGLPGSVRLGELDPHIVDYQPCQAIEDPRTLLPRKDGVDPRLLHDKGLKASYARSVSPCLQEAEAVMHAWFHDNAPVGHRTSTKSKTWGFGNIPVTEPCYLIYGAMDAVAVKVLYDATESYLKSTQQWEHAEREMLLQWDCDNMVFRGVPVDPPYVRWLAGELDEVVRAETPFLAEHDIKPSGMGPSVAVAMAATGARPLSYTDKGAAQWNRDALTAAIEQVPGAKRLATAILAVRRAGKFKSAYVDPMIESLYRDCRIHCNFRSIGTITHRNSASDPPLQQQPKKDTRVRAAFGGIPGWVWVTCDLEQGEPRFMAALSGDPNYVAAVNSGDVNNATATAAFGDAFLPAEGKIAGTESYLMRQSAKVGLLAVCYAVGLVTLAKSMKLSAEKTKQTMMNWRTQFRVMFQRGDRLNSQEYVVLPSGRRIILWDRKQLDGRGQLVTSPRPSRKGLNYETQGAQADWIKAAWLRLRGRWSWGLAFFLHDEIALFVPIEFAEQAAADLEREMSGYIGNGITMLATATIEGTHWAPQPKDFDPSELESVDA